MFVHAYEINKYQLIHLVRIKENFSFTVLRIQIKKNLLKVSKFTKMKYKELNLINNIASKKDKGKVKEVRGSKVEVENIWDGKGEFQHEPIENVQDRKVSCYKSP